MSYNDAIKRLYRSYPEGQYRYKTLEFWHPTMAAPVRIYKAAVDVDKSFTLEAGADRNPGESVAFAASSFDITEPSVEKEANSDIQITLGINAFQYINEIIDGIEVDAEEFLTPLEVIYRIYHNQDMATGPSATPVLMYVSNIGMEVGTGVNLSANTTNNAIYRTGRIYTVDTFPGLVTGGT